MDALNAELVPLEGGHTGETFLAIGPEGPSVVRLYTGAGDRRGPDAANIDAELLKWMRGLLPVPEVLEVRRPDAALGLPALLVTSRLQGVRGDHVLGSLDSGGRGRVAKELAKILVRLSLVRTPRWGVFAGADLRMAGSPDLWRDLEAFLKSDGRELTRGWSARERAALQRRAAEAQELVDGDPASCLVHGDFQPSNLLLDPDRFQVTGLVDWERARSGHRYEDLGRLLRAIPDAAFRGAVLEALDSLEEALGLAPTNQRLEKARAADLFALVERASQRSSHPEVKEAQHRLRELSQ